jgi:hypothetical protein
VPLGYFFQLGFIALCSLAQNFLTKPARVKVRIACARTSLAAAAQRTHKEFPFFCESVKRYIGRSGIISHRQNTCMRTCFVGMLVSSAGLLSHGGSITPVGFAPFEHGSRALRLHSGPLWFPVPCAAAFPFTSFHSRRRSLVPYCAAVIIFHTRAHIICSELFCRSL